MAASSAGRRSARSPAPGGKDWRFRDAFEGLSRFKEHFEVVHVHANDSAGVAFIRGAPIPFVIEVSFADRFRHDTIPSREAFPTALDRPNDAAEPDHDLGTFEP